MEHAIYLTGGETCAAIAFAVLIFSLAMLAAAGIQGSHKLERGDDDVRHRPAKQNSDL